LWKQQLRFSVALSSQISAEIKEGHPPAYCRSSPQTIENNARCCFSLASLVTAKYSHNESMDRSSSQERKTKSAEQMPSFGIQKQMIQDVCATCDLTKSKRARGLRTCGCSSKSQWPRRRPLLAHLPMQRGSRAYCSVAYVCSCAAQYAQIHSQYYAAQ